VGIENKKVENWTTEEYEEFWNQYVEEQFRYYCEICHRLIDGHNVSDHMESKHSDYYEKHNQKVEAE